MIKAVKKSSFLMNKMHVRFYAPRPIKKILISNRGEVAVRIIKTARRLGIRTVSIYSDADEEGLHATMADEAYHIGSAPAQESYLCIEKIIKIAKISECQAIHPGYGFLSESAEFAEQCIKANIIFIGPPSAAIRNMGIKNVSKYIMANAGVPVISGYHGLSQNMSALMEQAKKIGFPLLIKAARGGGGKGMRYVKNQNDFIEALKSARHESFKAFGDSSVLLEQLVKSSRHIEVQIFADQYGNTVHLFERDCSMQRRHQKIIEEAPAPNIPEELRFEIGRIAIKAAKAVGYVGAGTVEFILNSEDNSFKFMEMNTRLQVEHPITEMITGIDLVAWQIKIASGAFLPLTQEEIVCNGHAFEARVYAEDPRSAFLPCPGFLKYLTTPRCKGNVRIDSGFLRGHKISVHYDPLVAKLVVWGHSRLEALTVLVKSLSELHIAGVDTNINFLLSLCKCRELIEGNVHTDFVSNNYLSLFDNQFKQNHVFKGAMALFLNEIAALKKNSNRGLTANNDVFSSSVSNRVNHLLLRNYKFKFIDKVFMIFIKSKKTKAEICNDMMSWKAVQACKIDAIDQCKIRLKIEKSMSKFCACIGEKTISVFTQENTNYVEITQPRFLSEYIHKVVHNEKYIVAPMSGILGKVLISVGDKVRKGDTIAVIIAMKMEYVINAPCDAVIKSVIEKNTYSITKGTKVVTFDEDDLF